MRTEKMLKTAPKRLHIVQISPLLYEIVVGEMVLMPDFTGSRNVAVSAHVQ